MVTFVYSVIGFILAIAILVTVHEFGHYWVAKKLGVKVLRFSVGFGKPLKKWIAGKDNTEYVIAAIPLGGYVKMMGEGDKDFSEEESHRAFDRQKLWKRACIVAAGPVINFLFAILIYTGLNMYGFTTLKPVVGDLPDSSILFKAGVRSGDELLSIDGKEVTYFDEYNLHIFNKALKQGEMELLINRNSEQKNLTIDFSELKVRNYKPTFLGYEIGLVPVRAQALPYVGKLSEGFPAQLAGLLEGDHIVRINGVKTPAWAEVVAAIQQADSGLMDIGVMREGAYKTVSLRPKSVEYQGKLINQIGVYPRVKPVGDEFLFYHQYTGFDAFTRGVSQTWDMSALTLRMLWKMLVGQASYKNISGPVSIASFAGEALQVSWSYYLTILAVISISLGVMNLLPIPMLDGGHLLYYAAEAVKGSPVSEKAMLIGQKIGLLLLGALMSLAFYNDIFRLLS